MVIVKVQAPLNMNPQSSYRALVYNHDRSINLMIEVDKNLREKLQGSNKGFFKAHLIGKDKIHFIEKIEWQNW